MVADSVEALGPADQREVVEEHLRECVQCSEYRHHLLRIEAAVSVATAPLLSPDPAIEGGLRSAVRARAQLQRVLTHANRARARSELPVWRAAFAVAAVVALVLVSGSVGPFQNGSAVAAPGLTAVLLSDSKPESTRTDALDMSYRLRVPPLYETAAQPSPTELFPSSSTSAGSKLLRRRPISCSLLITSKNWRITADTSR